MLKLTPNPTFTVGVGIAVAGEPDISINITYRRKTKAELRDFAESLKTREDLDVISEIVAGWDGVEVEFSPESLAVVLDIYPGAAVSLIDAYLHEIGRAKTKN